MANCLDKGLTSFAKSSRGRKSCQIRLCFTFLLTSHTLFPITQANSCQNVLIAKRQVVRVPWADDRPPALRSIHRTTTIET